MKKNRTKLIDITGQRFGKLTVIERAFRKYAGGSSWRCRCDCGNEVVVYSCNLRNGSTSSCGCAQYNNGKPRKFIKLPSIPDVAGLSIKEIMQKHNVSETTAHRWKRAPAEKIIREFIISSRILGILWANGYLGKKLYYMHSTRKEALEEVREFFGLTCQIAQGQGKKSFALYSKRRCLSGHKSRTCLPWLCSTRSGC